MTKFYDGFAFIEEGIHGIITARDIVEHAQMRRHLSHAFGTQALNKEEVLVHEIVDLLIDKVREIGAKEGEVMEFERWLRMCMFDLMGSLVFWDKF